MSRLVGKVAIVSGSGRGIGRALAIKLAAEGASVVVNDLDAASVMAVIAEIEASGGQAAACVGDVTAADFGERFVATALDRFGGLDIIVNNAGYTRDGVIQKQSDAQFQAMLDVHVMAPFRILRAAAEPIRLFARQEASEGREVIRKVVNISSISGINGNPGQINYAAAKSALIGMTKTLAKEWGRFKVCVNCVGFGLIDTRLTQPNDAFDARIEIDGEAVKLGVPAGAREAVEAMIPMGRAGTPEEAADGAYLFCAPESDYISGEVVLVAGGLGI
ncbi:MAG: SDR family oxidoreductase [Sphingomonadales bacterium]|nr:SDR family oxidoreductase [Sphingomonadales bacterium]